MWVLRDRRLQRPPQDEEGLRLFGIGAGASGRGGGVFQLEEEALLAVVDQLEAAGYLARTPHPHDARARLIRITSKGREVIAVAAPVQAAIEAEWAAHLGARRMQQLTAALLALRDRAHGRDHRRGRRQ